MQLVDHSKAFYPCDTEVEVACLDSVLTSLKAFHAEAVIVIGPDISCHESQGRSLRTMLPWCLYDIARDMARTAPHILPPDSLPGWVKLHLSETGRTSWGKQLTDNGFGALMTVHIPLAMEQSFEFVLLSRRDAPP